MDKTDNRRKRRRAKDDTSSEQSDSKDSTKRRKLSVSKKVKKIDVIKCEVCNNTFMRNYRHFYKHKCSGEQCNICEKMRQTDLKLFSHRCAHIKKKDKLDESSYEMPSYSKVLKDRPSSTKSNKIKLSTAFKKNRRKCIICEAVVLNRVEMPPSIETVFCRKCKVFSPVTDANFLKHSPSELESEAENIISKENKVTPESIEVENKIAPENIAIDNKIAPENVEIENKISPLNVEIENKISLEKISNDNKITSGKVVKRNKTISKKVAKEKKIASKNIEKISSGKRAKRKIALEATITNTSKSSSVDLKTESDSTQSNETSAVMKDKSYISSIESSVTEMIPEKYFPYVSTEYVSDETSGFLVRKNFKKRDTTVSINLPVKKSIENSPTLSGGEDKIQLRKKVHNYNQKEVSQNNLLNLSPATKRSVRKYKKQEHTGNISVTELKLERILSDVNTGVLLRHPIGNDIFYECVKCSTKFSSLQLGTNHFVVCDKKVDKSATVSMSNTVWICNLCRQHLDSYTELLKHKISCSETLMQRSVNDTTHKKMPKEKKASHCKRCGYSCLSPAIFVKHKCGDRLKKMMNCVVGLNMVPVINAETTDKVIYFHCSVCDKDFFESDMYENHMQNKHPTQYDGHIKASSLSINKPVQIKIEKDTDSAKECEAQLPISNEDLDTIVNTMAHFFAETFMENHLNADNSSEKNLSNDPILPEAVSSSDGIKSEGSEDRCGSDTPNAPGHVPLIPASTVPRSDDMIQSNSLTDLYKEIAVEVSSGSLNFSWCHSIKEVSAYACVSRTSIKYVCTICYEDMPKENLHEHFRAEHSSADTELKVLYVIDSMMEPDASYFQ